MSTANQLMRLHRGFFVSNCVACNVFDVKNSGVYDTFPNGPHGNRNRGTHRKCYWFEYPQQMHQVNHLSRDVAEANHWSPSLPFIGLGPNLASAYSNVADFLFSCGIKNDTINPISAVVVKISPFSHVDPVVVYERELTAGSIGGAYEGFISLELSPGGDIYLLDGIFEEDGGTVTNTSRITKLDATTYAPTTIKEVSFTYPLVPAADSTTAVNQISGQLGWDFINNSLIYGVEIFTEEYVDNLPYSYSGTIEVRAIDADGSSDRLLFDKAITDVKATRFNGDKFAWRRGSYAGAWATTRFGAPGRLFVFLPDHDFTTDADYPYPAYPGAAIGTGIFTGDPDGNNIERSAGSEEVVSYDSINDENAIYDSAGFSIVCERAGYQAIRRGMGAANAWEVY